MESVEPSVTRRSSFELWLMAQWCLSPISARELLLDSACPQFVRNLGCGAGGLAKARGVAIVRGVKRIDQLLLTSFALLLLPV